jgi:hypothetical protein
MPAGNVTITAKWKSINTPSPLILGVERYRITADYGTEVTAPVPERRLYIYWLG